MIYNEGDHILVFATHNQAVFLYNKLVRMGMKVELISTPCKISAGCTQSIKFRQEDIDRIRNEAINNNMYIKGIYKVIKNGAKYGYVKIQ